MMVELMAVPMVRFSSVLKLWMEQEVGSECFLLYENTEYGPDPAELSNSFCWKTFSPQIILTLDLSQVVFSSFLIQLVYLCVDYYSVVLRSTTDITVGGRNGVDHSGEKYFFLSRALQISQTFS